MSPFTTQKLEPLPASGWRAVAVLVALSLGASVAVAQEPKPAGAKPTEGKPADAKPGDAKKAQDEATRAALAVSEAIGLRRPIEAMVGAVAGLGSPSAPAKKVPPRVTQLFEKYPVEDGAPLPLWKDDAPETQLYSYLLSLGQQVERSTFERAARKDIPYEQVFEEPAKFRGEVVHVEGILRKLKRVEPPEYARRRGVEQIYIGWVFDPKNPNLNRPWYVVFTRLPSKLDFKDRPDRRVTFDGYFFKRLRFEVEDSWFDAPLVIGRTPALVNELPSDVAYRLRGSAAAASVAALGGPLPMTAPLATGMFNQTWPAVDKKPWDVKLPDVASKLDLSPFTIIDGEPVLSYDQDRSTSSEAIGFSNVVIQAHRMPQEAIKRGAQKHRDLTYPHFMKQSEKYRGEVVHIEGTLARLRRYDPSRFTKAEGITAEYEGWLYDPKTYGNHAICIYFTELPPGFQVGEKLNEPIAFDGFFFKRYRYKTSGDRWLDAPLLIGRTIERRVFDMAPAQHGIATNKEMIMAFLGVLLMTMSVGLGAAFFYRRGDNTVRSRLASASNLSFTEISSGPVPEGEVQPPPPPTGADPTQFTGFPRSTD